MDNFTLYSPTLFAFGDGEEKNTGALVRRFGGRLSFHGCISTAGALAYGTPDDVRADVKRTLDIMMPTCSYHLAPTHQIQDNSPVENVVAMYQAAHDYGVYR